MPTEQAEKLPFFLQQMAGKPAPPVSTSSPQRVKKLVEANGIQSQSLVPSPCAKWISRMVKFPMPHET